MVGRSQGLKGRVGSRKLQRKWNESGGFNEVERTVVHKDRNNCPGPSLIQLKLKKTSKKNCECRTYSS